MLARVRAVDPTVSRVAAVRWSERDTARPVFDAITMGKIDHWVTRPAQNPDEEFHQSITQFLGEWRSERGGGFEAMQVIGERWSARSEELRDTFSRNGTPLSLYDADSARGRLISCGWAFPVGALRPLPGRVGTAAHRAAPTTVGLYLDLALCLGNQAADHRYQAVGAVAACVGVQPR